MARQLPSAVASLVGRRLLGAQFQLLQRTGSVVVAHGLSCSMAYGIFLDQESNLCLLHWQVFSLLLSHQGSPDLRNS